MPKPIEFPEANSVLRGGPGPQFGMAPGNDVEDLHTFRDGRQIVSKWQLTLLERLQALLRGHVWVYVIAPITSPPIALSFERSVFTQPKETTDAPTSDHVPTARS